MTSRYCYHPAVYGRVCKRVSILDRLRRRLRKVEEPDVFPTCGYNAPVFPGK